MKILRPHHADEPVQVNRTAVNDGRLSFAALGFYAWLCALPQGTYELERLAGVTRADGTLEEARKLADELRNAGYLRGTDPGHLR